MEIRVLQVSASPRQFAGDAAGVLMEGPAVSVSSEEGSQPLKTLATQNRDWVRAVQGNQKSLKKYEVDIMMKDGVGSVNVPDAVVKDSSPLWEDFLMGKFLDKAPHIAKVHAIVNKIWSMGDMVDVYVINANTMKFRVSNISVRNRILRRGMWNLAGVPVVMSKWTPFIEDDQPEEKSIPLWVHLKNVPTSMVSWEGLSFITSPVGVPVRLHPETAQCINIKTPKIFVNADLTKELPKKMFFNLLGKETLVEYSYPWLPSRCSNCMKWGHLEKACLVAKRTDSEIQQNVEVEEVEEGEILRATPIVGEKLTEENEHMTSSATNQLEREQELTVEPIGTTGKIRGLEVTEKTLVGEELAENRNDEENKTAVDDTEWSDVTPGKSSRSPRKLLLEVEQSPILSNSRFSVLSSTEEDGEEEVSDAKAAEAGSVDNSEANTHKEKEKQVAIIRQSLPRDSKDRHKYLSDSNAQKAKALGKKSSRQNH